MTSASQPQRPSKRYLIVSLLAILTSHVASAQTAPRSDQAKTASNTSDDTVVLSPFIVDTKKDSGYFAENTLAGSRLNTNLSDLGAGIGVVTKQQMVDTAALGINDVFRYEVSTEGSRSYSPAVTDRGTLKDTIGGYTFGNDGTTTTNSQSNRVRGLSSPDSAIDYFPSNPRIPFDTYNTQSVEISRGPNSLLFGLGSPAGIVNQTTSEAQINKNNVEVQLRTDDNGSYRGELSFNRTLIQDKLAIYAAALYDNEQFERKPSFDLTRRQFAAITYKPFKSTTIRAFAENYINNANRPNFVTPRDWVTPWLKAGRPAYDPIARTVTVLDTGKVTGPYTLSPNSPGTVPGVPTTDAALTSVSSPFFVPGIFWGAGNEATRPVMRIDNGQLVDWFQRQPVFYAPVQTNPPAQTPTPASLGFVKNDPRYAINDRRWTASTNFPNPTVRLNSTTPYYSAYQNPDVTNQSIYDWTKFNTNQTNFARTRAGNYSLQLDQEILPDLFLTAGWFRQNIDAVENYTVSQLTGATLTVDTNLKLPDGSVNPYFGLPYLEDTGPDTFYLPEIDDNFRLMLAYNLDFTKRDGWWRWLGRHRLLALGTDQRVDSQVTRSRLTFTAADADGTLRYLPDTAVPGTALWSPANIKRFYYLASPGDAQNGSVTHSLGNWGNQGFQNPYSGSINVYNYSTGNFQKDQVTEAIVFAPNGSFKTQRRVKGQTFGTQSYLWDDRIIATLGWHRDDYKARITTIGPITDDKGTIVTPALTNPQLYDAKGLADERTVMNRWNRWDRLTGESKTADIAFRPLKGWSSLDHAAESGSVIADIARSVTLYYNESSNFNPPATFQTDYFFKPLPKPEGNGRDIGIGFSAFDNKLVARISWFKTTNQNERTAAAATLLTRLAYGDTTLMYAWAKAVIRLQDGANTAAANWNDDAAHPMTAAQDVRAYALLQLPVNYYAGASIGGTQNSKSKGTELQITFNPTRNWTLKLTGSKTEASYTDVAPQYDAWLAVRMPIWTSTNSPTNIPDFVDGGGVSYSLNHFWTAYGYSSNARITDPNGNTSSQAYFATNVTSQVSLAKALQGASSPDLRKYHSSLVTNYIFSRSWLKGFSIGGAETYESKGTAGYFGHATNPATPNFIDVVDVTRPIYSKENYYTDLWIAYTTKICNDKVGMKIQLNAENITEGGHLDAITYNLDGTPYGYRIVDPRRFILTSTFTF